jgi:hypothetical protein
VDLEQLKEELKEQPRLVAFIEADKNSEPQPLFSSFPTFAPTEDHGLPIFGQPSPEPTSIRNCDPAAPPCKTWAAGICVVYHKCYGIHSTPVNATFDDDNTPEPTRMPVPAPSPRPSNPPTSVPSTSAPTFKGYTPSPTKTMKPTVAETSGPTQTLLCDPQNPPCDNYFFGVCLGVRHCDGTHQPTPKPSMAPTPGQPTHEPTPVPSTPTIEPTTMPTDFFWEAENAIKKKAAEEKAAGELLRAKSEKKRLKEMKMKK